MSDVSIQKDFTFGGQLLNALQKGGRENLIPSQRDVADSAQAPMPTAVVPIEPIAASHQFIATGSSISRCEPVVKGTSLRRKSDEGQKFHRINVKQTRNRRAAIADKRSRQSMDLS